MVFSEINKVKIRKTNDIRSIRSNSYVEVSASLAKRLGFFHRQKFFHYWGVLVFYHPYFAKEVSKEIDNRAYIAIHCRVVVDESLKDPSVDSIVKVDQTLRNALGIPYKSLSEDRLEELEIFLFPAYRTFIDSASHSLASLFGVRYLACRPQRAFVPDIEKGYIRIHADALKSLASFDGDKVILEKPLLCVGPKASIYFRIVSMKVSALAATDKMLQDRLQAQKDDPERYIDTREKLYNLDCFMKEKLEIISVEENIQSTTNEQDVPIVFMDADTRAFRRSDRGMLTVFDPLMVRRSIRSAIARESVQSGITFGIAFLNMAFVFANKDHSNWWLDPTYFRVPLIVYALFISFLFSFMLLLFKIRQQI